MTKEELTQELQGAGLAKKSEIDALNEQMKSAVKAEEVEQLKADLKAATDALKDLNIKVKSVESVKQAPKEIVEFFKTDAGKEALDNMKSARVPSVFKLKTAGAMTVTANVLPNATGGMLASLILPNGEVFLINRIEFDDILSYVTVLSTDMAELPYVEEVAKTDAMALTDEGDAIPLEDWTYQEKKSSAVKMAGVVKVSNEALSDVSYMASSVTQVMNEKVYAKKGLDIVAGIVSGATAFSNTTTGYPTLAAPTWFDAINAMAAQSALKKFRPDAVAMHPTDVYALRSIKDSTGQPIVAFLNDGKTPYLTNGLGIILSFGITKGTAVVGTFKNFKVYDYELRLEMGFDSDDFSKDLRSLKAVSRYHKILPANQNNFVKGTIATIITALTTTPVTP